MSREIRSSIEAVRNDFEEAFKSISKTQKDIEDTRSQVTKEMVTTLKTKLMNKDSELRRELLAELRSELLKDPAFRKDVQEGAVK